MAKSALITGITGQDGSYLAEFLMRKGYEIHGLIRRSGDEHSARISSLQTFASRLGGGIALHLGDLTDAASLKRALQVVAPDEIYNLAAQSHVGTSFEIPELTANVTGIGPLRLLEQVRDSGHKVRFYQAGSSEMFGESNGVPHSEQSPFNPRSPYAAAKAFAHHVTEQYRESYGLYACNGILFNHESPRRASSFVTRKITSGIANILLGTSRSISLGNIEAQRDWGYAPEYVEAMWMMLQQGHPGDYVVATGEMNSVRDFAQIAFGLVDLNWEEYVTIEPRNLRPSDVHRLVGDPHKIYRELGWKSRTKLRDLVRIMLVADLEAVRLNPARFAGLVP